MSITSKILMTCKHATLLVSKEQEKVITPFEKFRMHLHMLFCKFCTLFYKQSNLLHDALKNASDQPHELIRFDEKKKAVLQEIVDKEN